MVALAVFSLAVLALVRLEGATARGAATLDDTLLANLVARNVAVEAVTEAEAPAVGRSTGSEANGGRSWRWVRSVQRTGDARIVRIDVAVSGAAGTIVGRATMVRPPTPPGADPVPAPPAGNASAPR